MHRGSLGCETCQIGRFREHKKGGVHLARHRHFAFIELEGMEMGMPGGQLVGEPVTHSLARTLAGK
jgi:hypothetical protein